MIASLRVIGACLLPVWILMESIQAAVIVTFPLNPQLIVGYGENPNPLIIDFNGDGKGDVFMVGNGPAIDFFVADGNSALVLRPPPPNLGGLLVNLPTGFIISSQLDGDVYWYGGFPSPGVADILGLPLDINVVSFGSASTLGSNGYFVNASGYFGIEFQIGEDTHYGWVHITNETGLGHGGYIDAWAYESVAGQTIAAGAIPEPSTLLLCGIGFFGLLTRRRVNF